MKLAWSGCSCGEIPQLIVSDFPAGVPFEQASVEAEIRRYLKAIDRSDCSFELRILSGFTEGVSTGEPIVAALPGLEVLSCTNGETTSFVPRPGRGDLWSLLAFDANDFSVAQAWSRELFELEGVAAAALAQEYLFVLGVQLLSFTSQVGEARLDLASLDLSALEPFELELARLRSPNPHFAEAAWAEFLRADSEGYSPAGKFCLKVTGLLPAFGGRGTASFAAGISRALFAIEGVVGVRFLTGSAATSPKRLLSALKPGAQGLSYEANTLGGLESFWNTGDDLLIEVEVRPDMRSLNPIPSYDLESMQPTTWTDAAVPPLRVLSAAIAAESQLALHLAQLYATRFGGSSLAVTQAGVRAFKDRLKALSR